MTNLAGQHARVDHSLTNQPPAGDDVIEAFEELRDYFKNAGHAIVIFCPDGREKALALTHLEEMTMWAVKAIALNQEGAREQWERQIVQRGAGLGVIVAEAGPA
jgi:alkanesulfonate monooxygenase SsuD/methylene tetrahydromethanopterin reductase-like flavin-dependent oxidoreductase (luciferase family)